MSKIVFLGDSITEYMPYVYKNKVGGEEDVVSYHGVENIGVGCFHQYCWPRVKEQEKDADIFVLLIGTNNLSRPDCDYDERETFDDLVIKMKEMINDVLLTGSRLIVQSVYPTKYLSRDEDIRNLNSQVEGYCNLVGVEYVDTYSLLEKDGMFNEEYSDDGIHPNKAGYGLIVSHLNKYFVSGKKKLIKSEDN